MRFYLDETSLREIKIGVFASLGKALKKPFESLSNENMFDFSDQSLHLLSYEHNFAKTNCKCLLNISV